MHWADTDAGGRIHHTAAFRWAENTEHAFYRTLGLITVGNFVRRHVEATYHHPLVFGDDIDVILTVERTGTTSITYAWHVLHNETSCIDGRSVVVHVDKDGTPAPLPAALARDPGPDVASGPGTRRSA